MPPMATVCTFLSMASIDRRIALVPLGPMIDFEFSFLEVHQHDYRALSSVINLTWE